MKKLIILICIVLCSSCSFDDINIIGHKKKHKSPQEQKDYTLYIWGEGKYKITINEELNDKTTDDFNIILELDKIGFQVRIDTSNIKFPYNIVIENLDKSNAIYEFGELDNNVLNTKRSIEGKFGKFNKTVNSITLFIDIKGIIN